MPRLILHIINLTVLISYPQFMLQNIFSKFTELLVNPAEAKRKCRPEDGSFTVTLDSGQ